MKNYFNKIFLFSFFLLSLHAEEEEDYYVLSTKEVYKNEKEQSFESAAKDYAKNIIIDLLKINGFFEKIVIRNEDDKKAAELFIEKLVNKSILNKEFLDISKVIYEEQKLKTRKAINLISKFSFIQNYLNPVLLGTNIILKIVYEIIFALKSEKKGFSLSFFKTIKNLSKYSFLFSLLFYLKFFEEKQVTLKFLENGDNFKSKKNEELFRIIDYKILERSKSDILNFLNRFEEKKENKDEEPLKLNEENKKEEIKI